MKYFDGLIGMGLLPRLALLLKLVFRLPEELTVYPRVKEDKIVSLLVAQGERRAEIIIARGTALEENGPIPKGRAVNADPRSDTNVYILGCRTKRMSETAYYADDQCQELAEFHLKRNTVLQKSVTVQTSQIFHLTENNLVTIRRTDKPGFPVERHLLTGFSRPVGQTGAMQLNCTSVNDFPLATAAPAPGE